MMFTLVFSGVSVGAGDRAGRLGDLGHSGLLHIEVEADDWRHALIVGGEKLSTAVARVSSPRAQDEPGPTRWERMRVGPHREEAQRLASEWIANSNGEPVDALVESLTDLIEGLLDR